MRRKQDKKSKKQLDTVRTNRGKINERNTEWTGVNAYITNIFEDDVTTEQVHDIYSLGWKIETMIKVWKSIFNIAKVRNIKIERFKYFL
ncbi:transposase [Clostridium beijerinckii]|uniref:transposase n=1 Tax=Clostridium beijerinckii TaxID=1520 RepID=UPI003D6C993E